MNLPTQIIQIIDSFLNCRLFAVKYDNKISSTRKMMAGVPQGSYLSPSLFSIYTNDIPVLDKVIVVLFADDTMFTVKNHNTNKTIIHLQRKLDLASINGSKHSAWKLMLIKLQVF